MKEPKRRLRWDYGRALWRVMNMRRIGTPTCYWLAPCGMCGAEAHLANAKGLCLECRVAHDRRLVAIRWKAHHLVWRAIRDGELPRLDGLIRCVDCGAPAVVYDHRSYAEPLKVDPVCKSCNGRRGPALETAALVIHHPRRRPPLSRSSAG